MFHMLFYLAQRGRQAKERGEERRNQSEKKEVESMRYVMKEQENDRGGKYIWH